ncbi:hypothetical protein [Vibrio breoganii]|uniref:hypothetical protein n=1 Tax=Vibrio breoganii TaxID=553239 RepID=UPI000C84C4D3|nr:hypothetical protein [Vibrio breoganii]PMK29524.1 hypothetical protein BCU03_11025 [Vibrio breoganii]
MSYSEILIEVNRKHNFGSEYELKIELCKFIESIKGTGNSSFYYVETIDLLLILVNGDLNDFHVALESETGKQNLIEHIENSYKRCDDISALALEMLNTEFSDWFIEELEDAEEIIKEELIEFFEKLALQQTKQQELSEISKAFASR